MWQRVLFIQEQTKRRQKSEKNPADSFPSAPTQTHLTGHNIQAILAKHPDAEE